MGKRKSKSGKQKQTGKKTNHSGLLKKTPGGGKRTANDIKLLCSLPKPKAASHPTSNHHHRAATDEQHEFDKQLNSLVERSRAIDARGRTQRRRKHSGSVLPLLKPASFRVGKSTHQLMEETMHQMGQIMSSNSNNNNNHSNHTNHHSNHSSLARAVASIAPSELTPVASNVHKRSVSSATTSHIGGIAGIGIPHRDRAIKTNSFAALGSDSEEDDDDDEVAALSQATIRFAPSSFSLESSASSSAAARSLLPTKTPPTTPNPNANRHPEARSNNRSTSLFGTLHEEALEELHYQRQVGDGAAARYDKDVDDDL